MRSLVVFSTILLAAGLAAGQVTVVSGYASNTRTYAAPFVPLVTTPSVSLDAQPMTNTLFAQPSWYGPASVVQVEVPPPAPAPSAPAAQQEQGFRFGAARFQSSYSAAELAEGARISKTGKVYTNESIPQPSLSEGTVKYGDKTEHLQ